MKIQNKFKLHLTIILILFLVLSGCSLMKMPDSCDQDDLCELNQKSEQPAIRLKAGDAKNVTICACRPWNKSGIHVMAGQTYSFTIISAVNWVDGQVKSDPIDGWQGIFYKPFGFLTGFLKRSDKAPWYSLVGSIGLNDKDSFAIIERTDGSVRVDKTGELYFYANDMDGRYFNNKGKVILRVTLNQ